MKTKIGMREGAGDGMPGDNCRKVRGWEKLKGRRLNCEARRDQGESRGRGKNHRVSAGGVGAIHSGSGRNDR